METTAQTQESGVSPGVLQNALEVSKGARLGALLIQPGDLGQPFPDFFGEQREELARRLAFAGARQFLSAATLREAASVNSDLADASSVGPLLRGALLNTCKAIVVVDGLVDPDFGSLAPHIVRNDLAEAVRLPSHDFFRSLDTSDSVDGLLKSHEQERMSIESWLKSRGWTGKKVSDALLVRSAVQHLERSTGSVETDHSLRTFKVLNALAHSDEACTMLVAFAAGSVSPTSDEWSAAEELLSPWILDGFSWAANSLKFLGDRLNACYETGHFPWGDPRRSGATAA